MATADKAGAGSVAAQDTGTGAMNPGDEVPPGSPQSGEAICPDCAGTGELAGASCKNCGGSGKIIQLAGDA